MRNTLAIAAVLTFLAGCAHPDQMAPSFGESVEAMHRAQTIEAERTLEAPEGGGATGAAAQNRYNTGTTKPLRTNSTSSTSSSGR